jgi:ribosomal protein L7Ae-like RNA K-turn-binding protein
MVDRLMLRAALGALSIAHKAGEVVAGTGKVEDAIAGDRAVAILHATDAAPDGVRKLTAALRRRFPGDGSGENDRKVRVIRAFTSAELDLALGRSNVVHAALLAGRAGETFLMRWHDLWHFRMPENDPDYREDDAGVPSAAAPKLEME